MSGITVNAGLTKDLTLDNAADELVKKGVAVATAEGDGVVVNNIKRKFLGSAPQMVAVSQTVTFAAALAINLALGNYVTVGALTANVTHAAPTNMPASKVRVVYYMTQDATGGRTLTWSSLHKGAAPTASGTANQRIRVEFESDGVNLIFVSSSGWY